MAKTNRGERLHIGIFGRRNAGKSSLINAITNQDIALVSTTAGTTTDPVYKAMEILPIGPVVIIDTAGLDDSGELGDKRVKKTRDVLNKCDFALVVVDSEHINNNLLEFEAEIIKTIKKKNIPLIIVVNKIDLCEVEQEKYTQIIDKFRLPTIKVSSLNKDGIEELKDTIIKHSDMELHNRQIICDVVLPGEMAIMVIPIDNAAPKGRIILPQVQTIRELLDHNSMSLVVQATELKDAIKSLKKKPKIVITDSQAFEQVAADTPDDILLSSFSILFARYKGDLEAYLGGVNRIKTLQDGDKILVAEACTHHVQTDDIGTVKLPCWLKEKTAKDLIFEKSSGFGFPENLQDYALIIHCGACMLNRREVLNRIGMAKEAGIPITNYGVTIAYIFDTLDRALRPFPSFQAVMSL